MPSRSKSGGTYTLGLATIRAREQGRAVAAVAARAHARAAVRQREPEGERRARRVRARLVERGQADGRRHANVNVGRALERVASADKTAREEDLRRARHVSDRGFDLRIVEVDFAELVVGRLAREVAEQRREDAQSLGERGRRRVGGEEGARGGARVRHETRVGWPSRSRPRWHTRSEEINST